MSKKQAFCRIAANIVIALLAGLGVDAISHIPMPESAHWLTMIIVAFAMIKFMSDIHSDTMSAVDTFQKRNIP